MFFIILFNKAIHKNPGGVRVRVLARFSGLSVQINIDLTCTETDRHHSDTDKLLSVSV